MARRLSCGGRSFICGFHERPKALNRRYGHDSSFRLCCRGVSAVSSASGVKAQAESGPGTGGLLLVGVAAFEALTRTGAGKNGGGCDTKVA